MRIVIIDDEKNICISLKNILEDEGHRCVYALDETSANKKIVEFSPQIVFLDVKLGETDGLKLLKKIKNNNPDIVVIMISGHSGIKEAVVAIKSGAYDFLEKPLSLTKVRIIIKNVSRLILVSAKYDNLKKAQEERNRIVGESKAILDLKKIIAKVAKSNSKVLIRGESGTGKELIAFAIHNLSNRKDKSFVKFNSAAIPTELVESELFGYDKGAFTGANKDKKGKIELADGGTLFLDEIGDMSITAQAKILRAIQEGEFERVGSTKTRKIDTRIIAATNKNLEKMVKEGTFREDLFYRLNVIPIHSPSLREHAEDIPILINYFSNFFAKELNVMRKSFSPDALNLLSGWQFKGNVRELRNFVERIYILIEDQEIRAEDIAIFGIEEKEINFWNETKFLKEKRREFEIRYLGQQLRLNKGNISRTAEVLGLQVSNFSRKIRELGLRI